MKDNTISSILVCYCVIGVFAFNVASAQEQQSEALEEVTVTGSRIARTDPGFNGIELSAKAGAAFEGDGEQLQLDLTWGVSNERGSLMANLSYQDAAEPMSGTVKSDEIYAELGVPVLAAWTDANTDTMTYDLAGRRGYARLTYQWD